MKPAARYLLSGLATVLVLFFVAAIGVAWQTARTADASLLERLKMAAMTEADLQASWSRELQLRAETLANDPAFVDYVAQSLIPDPKAGGTIDKASIGDLLRERREGYDVGVLLDPSGAPVASAGILQKDDASIKSDALVTQL